MKQIACVIGLAYLIAGVVRAEVCPHWADEHHGGHVIPCCTVPPHVAVDNQAYCRQLGAQVGRDGARQLCFLSASNGPRRKRSGFLHGSPPPPPPTPSPGR